MQTTLFQRRGRRLELTEIGKQPFSHTDEIFQIGQELEALMLGDQEEGPIPFRAGALDVIPKSIAYKLLKTVLAETDQVQLNCHEGKLTDLLAQLAVQRTDVVIADRPLPSGLG